MRKSMQEITKIAGTHRDYEIDLKQAEEYFEDIFTKVLSNVSITPDEEQYLEVFFEKMYPKIGGELYPYPRYDEKLKEIYEKASNYYISQLNNNTRGSIIFLWYFHMTKMSKENSLKPRLYVGNDKFKTDKYKNCNAFHCMEKTGIGMIHVVYFNPDSVERCLKTPLFIIDLLNTSFHELEHACQEDMVKSRELINPQALIWAKEMLLRRPEILGNQYYDINYFDIFHERDARFYAGNRVNAVLEGKSPYRISNVEKDKYDLDVKHKENESSDKILAIDLLESITSKFIKENPNYLLMYPVLLNIYNEDGTKKSLSQIQNDLEERCNEEIKNNPSVEGISEKYEQLLAGICETDNDLKFQYLCLEASNFYASNDIEKFNITISAIKKLLVQRDMSYEEFNKKIQDRISMLDKEIYIVLHPVNGKKYDHASFDKLSKERDALKKVFDAILEYNPMFKQEHNEKIMKEKIKQELSRKIKREVGNKYKYFIEDDGNIHAVLMTEEEENQRYREEMQALIDANTKNGVFDGEAFEKDVHDLNTFYGGTVR